MISYMIYKTSRAYELDETTNTYKKTYPLTHKDAVFFSDNEDKTLGTKLTEMENETISNANKIGDLSGNGLTETDLATAIKNDRAQLSDIVYNVKNFGAKGDGTTDDTNAIKTAIAYCKTNNIPTLLFPFGTYIVSSTLTVDFPLNICGNARTNQYYANGTVIKYTNSADAPLFLLNGYTGGSIHDLSLQGTGLHDAIKTTGTGWDNSFYNLYIMNFFGSALNLSQDDGYFNNIFINTCGSGRTVVTANVRYAIYIGDSYHSNALHFNNIHTEHCQYMLNIKSGFMINFDSCKFEQSFSRFGTELSSPILIQSEQGISFNNCMFVGVNPLAFLYYDSTITLANLPYFIKCTSLIYSYGAIKLNGCNFTCGDGSGTATMNFMTNECLAIKTLGVPLVLTGNSFSYLATYLPAIVDAGCSTITGNTIHSIVRNYSGFLDSTSTDISATLNALAINGCVFGNRSTVSCNRFYHDPRNTPDVSAGRIKYIVDSQGAYCTNNIADGGYDVDRYFYKDISKTRNPSIAYMDRGNISYSGDYANLATGALYFSTGYDCFRYKDSKSGKSLLNNVQATFLPTANSGVTTDNTIFFDALDSNKPKVRINGTIYTITLQS